MVKEVVIYLAVLSSIITLMLLIDTKIKFKNKVLMALAAPIVGGLFILLGTIFLVFVLALIIFGGLFFLANKRRIEEWLKKGPRFGLYRYYSLF